MIAPKIETLKKKKASAKRAEPPTREGANEAGKQAAIEYFNTTEYQEGLSGLATRELEDRITALSFGVRAPYRDRILNKLWRQGFRFRLQTQLQAYIDSGWRGAVGV